MSMCCKHDAGSLERRPGGHTEPENRDRGAGISLEGHWKNPECNGEGIEEAFPRVELEVQFG